MCEIELDNRGFSPIVAEIKNHYAKLTLHLQDFHFLSKLFYRTHPGIAKKKKKQKRIAEEMRFTFRSCERTLYSVYYPQVPVIRDSLVILAQIGGATSSHRERASWLDKHRYPTYAQPMHVTKPAPPTNTHECRVCIRETTEPPDTLYIQLYHQGKHTDDSRRHAYTRAQTPFRKQPRGVMKASILRIIRCIPSL